ncbi:glycosyltransferase family 2 protein [Aestuariivivens sp. NBU2969]|uniref:glycosyltransferase family 2 protein n=1 Tax=Aestuariivivens sp. NBU2969 TaxID=2873267 RepID=UPI001CBC8911|nr:glycosyltransferase family 2 protein [Aestuariivivens sp. NBU2969]
MSQTPLVSVIMPVYNCELYVKEAVESILYQTYENFELIILDDASTDNTVKIVSEIKDSRIKFIKKNINTGYTTSLNLGVELAKGKYIARMDGDDVSLPERFEKQVAFLEEQSDVVVCGAWYISIGTGVIKPYPEMHEANKLRLLEGTCFAHPTIMLRKSVLVENQLKYDVFSEPAEDYALWVDLLQYGRFYNLQEPLLKYRIHDKQVSQERRAVQIESKLKTRIRLFKYLNITFSGIEQDVWKKVFKGENLDFNGLKILIKKKKQLFRANKTLVFFENDGLKAYLNTLEYQSVKSYFLDRDRFNLLVYFEYLNLCHISSFRFSIRTHVIFFIKSLLFFPNKK